MILVNHICVEIQFIVFSGNLRRHNSMVIVLFAFANLEFYLTNFLLLLLTNGVVFKESHWTAQYRR